MAAKKEARMGFRLIFCLFFISSIFFLSIYLKTPYALVYEWIDDKGVKHFSTEGAPPQYQKKTYSEIKPGTAVRKFAKFVNIPAGTFLMGSPASEEGRNPANEGQRRVIIANDFSMMTTEVTREMWERVMGPHYWTGKKCGTCPASGLPIDRIMFFINQLNLQEGLGSDIYRLPTVEEWEYACRAGTTTPFYTGKCLSAAQANIRTGLPFLYGDCKVEEVKTYSVKEVGSYPSNGWGLFDMHGNIAEICTTLDQIGKPIFVTKGGSYKNFAHACRCSARTVEDADRFDDAIGFRLVRITP